MKGRGEYKRQKPIGAWPPTETYTEMSIAYSMGSQLGYAPRKVLNTPGIGGDLAWVIYSSNPGVRRIFFPFSVDSSKVCADSAVPALAIRHSSRC